MAKIDETIKILMLKGEKGKAGIGISNIKKTASDGAIDTYTVKYTDGTETMFNVTNGKDGKDGKDGIGISNIKKTASDSTKDTYTITYTDGTETTYNIPTAIGGIQVGGRNLFYNSSLSENLDRINAINNGYTPDFTTEDGFKCLHVSGINSNDLFSIAALEPPMAKQGDAYTISADFKFKNIELGDSTNDFSLCGFYLGGEDQDGKWKEPTVIKRYNISNNDTVGVPVRSGSQDWKRIGVTAVYNYVPTKKNDFDLYFRNFTGDVYVKNIKLERGNVPTDWTPAPEDLETYADSKVTEINDNIFDNIETSTTASKTYTEGTYVSVNGKLKKVTSTIGQGSQFNSVNSQDTTIVNELKSVSGESYKETVLGSSTKNAYTHNVTLSEDPSNFDYLIILVTGGASNNKRMCYAKNHGNTWYTNTSATDYRHIGMGIDSQSGTSMRISTAEWESKSVNTPCAIDSIIGVKL